jgi:hypothetical protein
MCRSLAMLGLLALIAQGCATKPASYPLLKPTPLTSIRVDYQTWDCPDSRTKPISSKTRLRWLPTSVRLART